MSSDEVLVVGAGPTGLLMALSLASRGIPVRIVEKREKPTEQSRAIVVQARTIELYAQLAIEGDVLARGIPARNIHAIEEDGADRVVDIQDLGEGTTPYPHITCYPQDDHERMLVAKLRDRGIDVQWRTALTALEPKDDSVVATLTASDGASVQHDFAYVCGCDGAHSKVREAIGAEFEGGSYERLYFVADCTLASLAGDELRDLRVSFDSKILGMCFPVRPTEVRLIGIAPKESTRGKDLRWEDLRDDIERLLRVKAQTVHWFSTFHVHHRVAEHFRKGRCFLAGDAGHVHSPVGGQGMNTGLGDAFNLSWKLAAVLQGRALPDLLDTYEPERIAFARSLVATTDAIFKRLVGEDWASRVARRLAPHIIPLAFHFDSAREGFFKLASQVKIRYRDSALSEGRAGDVQGGDRLPWLASTTPDNFAPLRSNDWQLHVYGELAPDLASAAAALSLPVHVFTWGEDAKAAGFHRDAFYLIRPDGYVGLALPRQDPEPLGAYAARHGLTFRLC